MVTFFPVGSDITTGPYALIKNVSDYTVTSRSRSLHDSWFNTLISHEGLQILDAMSQIRRIVKAKAMALAQIMRFSFI